MKQIILIPISLFIFSIGFSQTPTIGNTSSEVASEKKEKVNTQEPKLVVSEKVKSTNNEEVLTPKLSPIEKKEEIEREESLNSSPN